MNTNALGDLAESKVIARLVELGFEVFIPLFCHSPLDLIAVKDEKFIKISVKGSSSKNGESFVAFIRTVRTNKTKTKTNPFDSSSCDVVAVYISQLDTVCFIPSNEINGVFEIRLRVTHSLHTGKTKKSFIIKEYLKLT
jgi:hypothetical protein